MKLKIDFRSYRTGIFLGLLFYSIFGILDYIMLPLHYKTAWMIRYLIVVPYGLIMMSLTFFDGLKKYAVQICYSLLLVGQFGIMAMLIISTPDEPAFYSYYAGSILMLLACEFLYEIPLKPSIAYFAICALLYLAVGIIDQQLLSTPAQDYNKNWLVGNFFLFLWAGFISLTGLYRLQRSRNEAEHANILKSAFLANISHEIRTPLNGLTGCAKLMVSPDLSEEQKIRFSEIINSTGDQLLNIVDSILTMSAIETGHSIVEIKEISLSDLLFDITRQFSFQAEQKDINFHIENLITKEQNLFKTDESKLRMILNNLLSNALKFTDCGAITFKAGFLSSDLRFVVEDTGIGFKSENSERIFESFYQIDKGYTRKFGGNGLGLAICKSFTELLGGSITAEGEEGKGSVFTVTLPLID